ncbi:hypothetical protein LSH36_200g00016 [Paralvinella palmiformis]|uniref:Uncharacterized protein n=1 Tax=Paralvinella palmiformis TaxID=53620 RepID=A0AAD9JPX5_9ANNE|nr:hypothetical protein LSH36_200g00016 [Paralvinella palmiformis]
MALRRTLLVGSHLVELGSVVYSRHKLHLRNRTEGRQRRSNLNRSHS